MRIQVSSYKTIAVVVLTMVAVTASGWLFDVFDTARTFRIEDLTVRLPWLLVAAGATLLYLALVVGVRIARQPRQPQPGPTTQDLGEETPAVAGMLASDFEVTRQALSATVLDLAARRVVDIEEAGGETYQVRIRPGEPAGLRPYERRVFDLLRSRAEDGVVHAAALTTGASELSKAWWKDFRKEVIADAQARGVSRDLWDGETMATLTVIAFGPAPFWWIAFGAWQAAFVYGITALVLLASLQANGRQRHTDLGLAATARWLGVRRFLRQGAFEHLPPTAVAVWERHLAYAAAFGVARSAIRAFPMGADDDHRAWSAHTGEWREVRIRYPSLWPPGWGMRPGVAVLVGLILLFVASVVFTVLLRLSWPPSGPWEAEPQTLPTPEAVRGLFYGALFGGGVALALAGVFVVWGLSMLIRGLADLGSAAQVTGVVLRIRRFGGGQNSRPTYYLALDDGKSSSIRAWRLRPAVWYSLRSGEYRPATAVVSPRLGFVESITPGGPAGL